MEVQVNRKSMEIPDDFTVSMLLDHINSRHSVAVFVNTKQLLMAEYDSYKLSENDNIKIIRPLGGG